MTPTPELVSINGRWPLYLAPHRAARPEWPHWEAARLDSMYEHIAPGDVVYDIGAEEGDLSALYAKWIGEDGQIVLFEPNPRVWSNIKYHFEANSLPTPQSYFVGFASDSTDSTIGPLAGLPDWPADADLPLISDHGFRHLAEETDITPQVRLDDFATESQIYPDVVTIDVEGAELHVLLGMVWLLHNVHPVVFLSIHPDFMLEMYNHLPSDIFEFLDTCRYTYTHLSTDHEQHWLLTPTIS